MDLMKEYYPSQFFTLADVEFDMPVLTILGVQGEQMDNRQTGLKEAKPVLSFQNEERKLVLSAGRVRNLQELFGKDARTYTGKSVQLRVAQVRGNATIQIAQAPPPGQQTTQQAPPPERAEDQDLPFRDAPPPSQSALAGGL